MADHDDGERADQRITRRVLLGGAAGAALSVAAMRPASALTRAETTGGGQTAAAGSGASSSSEYIETRLAPRWSGSADGSAGTYLGEQGLEPFSMLGATAPGLAGGSHVEVRALRAGGWGDWFELHSHHGTPASELEWVQSATGYQVRGQPEGTVQVHLARDRSGRPAASPRELLDASGGSTRAAEGSTPPIIARSAWTSRPSLGTEFFDTLKIGIVHHTVTANDYTPQQVPGILRSIQAYHMDVQGWRDIAYQFFVDIYGNLWEGREGGIDESFFGAHSLGFNAYSFGVANIGDFMTRSPSNPQLSALAELCAWKLKRYDIDAAGRTNIECTFDDTEYYKVGQVVNFPAIIGHRDTRPTECPGSNVYSWLPWLRNEAHNRQGKYTVKPMGSAVSAPGPLARNTDGRLEVFGIGVDGALKHLWQDPASPSAWSNVYSLGGSLPARPVSAVSNHDGRLEVFLSGTSGVPWHISQSPGSPSGWSGFTAIGSQPSSPPVVARNRDGRLEVFGVTTSGNLWRTAQTVADGNLGEIQVLGSGYAGSVGLGETLDNRLIAYAVTSGGALAATIQTAAGGSWGPLVTLGQGVKGTPAAGRNEDGRLEVFVLGTDDRLWHTWQSGFLWSTLIPMGDRTFSQPPVVTRNEDGRLELFAVATDGRLWHTFQLAPNYGWSEWFPMGTRTFAGPPAAIANADGRLEIFLLGADHTIWHTFQLRPNSTWSDYYPLAGGFAA